MSRSASQTSASTNRGLLVGIPLLVSMLFSAAYMAFLAPQPSLGTASYQGTSTATPKHAAPLTVNTPKAAPLKVEQQTTKSTTQTTSPQSTSADPQVTDTASTTLKKKALTNLTHDTSTGN